MQKVVDIRSSLKGKALDSRISGTDRPGTYRWWFREDSLSALQLNTFNPTIFKSVLIDDKKYYALYYGKAEDTIKARLNWHINKHSDSEVLTGFLSTLRLTLCALLLSNKKNNTVSGSEKEVNAFMDEFCIVQWFPNISNKAPEVIKDEIRSIEENEIKCSQYWYPLNIDGNRKKDTDKLEYYNKLKRLRSEIKKELINSI